MNALEKNLLPAGTATIALTLSRDAFVAEFGAPALLVRRIEREGGELESVLIASLSSRTVPLVVGLGFRTVMKATPRIDFAGIDPASGPQAERSRVRRALFEGVNVAVPLRKREDSGKAYTDRIALGRAMNNDIVLRHESISKVHAWLEIDDDGVVSVCDAGSRNGTFVGGRRLGAREYSPVAFGAEVRLAGIVGIVCQAETLWAALHDAGDGS